MSATHEITALLARWASGYYRALDDSARCLYKELRRLAAGYVRRGALNYSLQPIAIISEAYLRLLKQKERPAFESRPNFLELQPACARSW